MLVDFVLQPVLAELLSILLRQEWVSARAGVGGQKLLLLRMKT